MPHHGHNAVSKVTLDIICATAFGYESNSLTNPHNALTRAYEDLINRQSGMIVYSPLLLTSRNSLTLHVQGPNLAVFSTLISIPGMPTFFASEWSYHLRHWLRYPRILCARLLSVRAARIPVAEFVPCMHSAHRDAGHFDARDPAHLSRNSCRENVRR